jgi:hypothetical protein
MITPGRHVAMLCSQSMREPEVNEWVGKASSLPLMAGMMQANLMTARL